jgi:hypothetical protein
MRGSRSAAGGAQAVARGTADCADTSTVHEVKTAMKAVPE